jgi:hypothetical protein
VLEHRVGTGRDVNEDLEEKGSAREPRPLPQRRREPVRGRPPGLAGVSEDRDGRRVVVRCRGDVEQRVLEPKRGRLPGGMECVGEADDPVDLDALYVTHASCLVHRHVNKAGGVVVPERHRGQVPAATPCRLAAADTEADQR